MDQQVGNGVAVLENSKTKLLVDLSILTDRQLTEQQSNIVAYFKDLRQVIIFEIACALEPLV